MRSRSPRFFFVPMNQGLSEALSGGRSIGLALGGGAARGCAHVGILRALEEAEIPISCIAGTSIGALVGAVYGAGGLENLAEVFLNLDPLHLLSYLDVTFPRSGLVDGWKITEVLRKILDSRTFSDLAVPFSAVATDLTRGEAVVLSSGDVTDAVRASIAVPGIFTPFVDGEAVLVDGGLVDPVPVDAVRSMGAQFVIAVDLNHYVVESKTEERLEKRADPSMGARLVREIKSLMDEGSASQFKAPNILDVMMTSINIMESSITENRLITDPPDLLLTPRLGGIRFLDFHKAQEAMDAGYRSAMEAVL